MVAPVNDQSFGFAHRSFAADCHNLSCSGPEKARDRHGTRGLSLSYTVADPSTGSR